MSNQIGEIDWGAIFEKVTSAIPDVTKAVYDYKTKKIEAKTTVDVAKYTSPFTVNPNYSGTYSNFPATSQFGGGTNIMPLLLIGGIGIAAFLLLKD